MSKILEGKVAVVTGSGQGIGRAIAMAMAAEGAMVVTNNRKKGKNDSKQISAEAMASMTEEEREALRKKTDEVAGDAETTANTINSLGGKAVPFFGDISKFDVAKELIETAVKSFGSVDIVANVAGAFGFGSICNLTEETWDRVNSVKPKGYFNTIHFAAPYMMEKKWGRIINCTSRAFLGDWILHPEYCAANAGVVGLTRAVAIELFPYNITCNAFDPFARTRAGAELEAVAFNVKDGEKRLMPDTPIPPYEMMPLPEGLTPFINYLCTDEAEKISGSVFSLAGNSIGIYSEPTIKSNITKYAPENWTHEELKMAVPMNLTRGYVSLADPSNRH